MVNSILFDLLLLIPPVTKRISYVSSILFELHRDKNTSWRIYVISRTDLGKDTFQRFYNNKLGHSHWGGRAKWNEGGNCHSWQSKCLTHLGSCCSPALPLVWTRLSLISGEDGGWMPLLGAARSQGPNALMPNATFISGFATVRTLLLLLCALLPIFVLFSDLSKIFTSADQHSAQTTHFLEKEDFLPPTASSLHSGDR